MRAPARLVVPLALLAALAAPAAAQDRCWLLCHEEVVLEGAEAAERLEGWLDVRLPAGTTMEGYREGGFQDTFVQARLEVDAAGLGALLDALGRPTLSAEPASPPNPGDPAWWDWGSRGSVKAGEGTLPRLQYATLRLAPVPGTPGRWTAWLWAFQT